MNQLTKNVGWQPFCSVPFFTGPNANSLDACSLTLVNAVKGGTGYGPLPGTAAPDTNWSHMFVWPDATTMPAGTYAFTFNATVNGIASPPVTGLVTLISSVSSVYYREFAQTELGPQGILNSDDFVLCPQNQTGVGLSWRMVGMARELAGATASSLCRLHGSVQPVAAFSGLPVGLVTQDEDCLLMLPLSEAAQTLPTLLAGTSSLYEFYAIVITGSGVIRTAPIMVAAVA